MNIWKSWFLFRRGKKATRTIDGFAYSLEAHLCQLHGDIERGTYRHGEYISFVVADNKRRDVSVASVRDRVVHRLLYQYLVEIYDQVFIFDVWSCRQGKGLSGAIKRAQLFLTRFPRGFIWRADIKKFFDNVNHAILMDILALRITDPLTFGLLTTVIESYDVPDRERERERERG